MSFCPTGGRGSSLTNGISGSSSSIGYRSYPQRSRWTTSSKESATKHQNLLSDPFCRESQRILPLDHPVSKTSAPKVNRALTAHRIERAPLTTATDSESSQFVDREYNLESWTSASATATNSTETGESESTARLRGTYRWNDCFGSLLTAARFEERPYHRGKI